jgi:hypothetical protein
MNHSTFFLMEGMLETENWNQLLSQEDNEEHVLEAKLRKIFSEEFSHQSSHSALNFAAPCIEETQLQMDSGSSNRSNSLEDFDSSYGSDSATCTPPVINQCGGLFLCRSTDEERRRRHLELEVQRRKRMNEKYDELYNLCKPASKNKASILESATEQLEEHNYQIYSILSALTPFNDSF